ncbi:MAG: hypothetical protein HWN65_20470 [Candidatus Helarchaeota archaeon]|nr:hypothetical protein [Candidatus Helarchaeota archaeon]
MTVLEAIKAKVIPSILPTKEEDQKINQIINSLKQNLQIFAEKLDISPNFIQNHGSTGMKQTHLRGTSDLDIFIGLNPSDYATIIELPAKKRKNALKVLFLSYVNDWFIPATQSAGFTDFKISYAEHPYLLISHENYEIDVVGCFDLEYDFLLKQGPITAVDRTPWHSKIVAEKLDKKQKNDVRLLKAFLQNNFVYGDKNTLGRFGFTGFSAEVLILHFKTLEEVFSKFEGLTSAPLDFFNRSAGILRKNQRFQNDFLIVIDPVDKNRNLAASISQRAYKFALYQIKQFLKSPNIEFFNKPPLTPLDSELINKVLPNHVVVEFTSDGTVHYTELRDKLYSTCEKLRKLLENETTGEERFGTTLFEVFFEDTTFVAVFYCDKKLLSTTYLRKGPPKNRPDNIKQFRKKHPTAFYKDGLYYVSVERTFREPIPLIKHFLQNSKQIKGLTLTNVSQKGTTSAAERALSLMLSCVLPLYGVINP